MGGLNGKEDVTAADFYGRRDVDEFGSEIKQKVKGEKGDNKKGRIS